MAQSGGISVRQWYDLERSQYLGRLIQQGNETEARAALAAGTESDVLAAWLSLQLHGPLPDPEEVPPGIAALTRAWQLYDSGWVALAQADFLVAYNWSGREKLPASSALAAEIALGLGKTHTRSGHWCHAKGWLLAALSAARRCCSDILCCKVYGALGELFVRAGHPAAGFFALNTAYRLLPPGAGQRARQLNYLGTALGRLGQPLRAESILMTALQIATDQRDTGSVLHSLARLLLLAARHPELPMAQGLDETPLATQAPDIPAGSAASGLVSSLAAFARARFCETRDGPTDSLAARFEAIAEGLDPKCWPMETAWILAWNPRRSDAQAATVLKACTDIMSITPVPAPAVAGVMDTALLHVEMPAGNGFARLADIPAGRAALLALDELFFA